MSLKVPRRLNLDKQSPDYTDHTWINKNKLLPQGNSGIVVFGPPGSGKTNEVLSAVVQPDQMLVDQLWIWTMDTKEAKYKWIKKKMKERGVSMEYGPDGELPDFILSDDFETIPPIKAIDKKKQTVIIFDDLVMESKKIQKPIVDFYKGARKNTCMCFYLSQGVFETPKMVRRCSDYFWIYRMRDPREFRTLATSIDLRGISKPTFYNIYIEATKDIVETDEKTGKQETHPGFLFINTKMSYVPYRFRRGFDQVLAETPVL